MTCRGMTRGGTPYLEVCGGPEVPLAPRVPAVGPVLAAAAGQGAAQQQQRQQQQRPSGCHGRGAAGTQAALDHRHPLRGHPRGAAGGWFGCRG